MNFWCQMDPGFNPSSAFSKPCVFGQVVKTQACGLLCKRGITPIACRAILRLNIFMFTEYQTQGYTCILWFIVRRFIALRRYGGGFFVFFFFFTNGRFVATLSQAESTKQFFQQHLLTSCLCALFWKSFQLFHYYYICYGDLWSVIFDVIIVIILGHHKPHSYKTVNLIDKCCVCSDCSTEWSFLSLSLS